MKLFVARIVVFLGIMIIPLLLLSSYVYYANSKLIKNYKIGSKVSIIVIGDSHTQKAINDNYLPDAINLSQSSECILYSFVKLQTILQTNPNIKTVLLGCGYNSFSSYYDEFIYGTYSAEVSSRYFFVMPDSLKMKFIYFNRNTLSKYLKKIVSNGITNLRVSPLDYSFLGRFETYSTIVKLSRETVNKRIETQYYSDRKLDDFSLLNILYFRKVIDLCKKRNVRLIIIHTPSHKFYIDNVPGKFKARYDSLIKESKISAIEFNDLLLPDSCFLPDGDHVTDYGAKLTTLYLADYLKNKN